MVNSHLARPHSATAGGQRTGPRDACRLVFTLASNSAASTRAVCRGVGHVETDSWHMGNWHSGYGVIQLERYDVVLRR